MISEFGLKFSVSLINKPLTAIILCPEKTLSLVDSFTPLDV